MKRLLAVCDLNRTAWAMGEMIHLQELSLMERYEHALGKIDVLWFLDPDPNKFYMTPKQFISKCSVHYYLSKLLPLAYVNQHLGSFILMDSLDFTLDFIEKNADRYHVFPPVEFIKSRSKFYHKNALKKICDFYDRNGFIPKLSCSPAMMMWARSFIEENNLVYPITTQLRKRPFAGGKRNSKLQVWLEFFKFCQEEYKKFKFIVLGAREEIDPRFRKLKNIVFAKDYGTTAEQDFALLASSVMFIGPNSGPMTWARCCGLPYLVFNRHSGREQFLRDGMPLSFATSVQKDILEVETFKLVRNEFAAFTAKIDFKRWKREFEKCKVEGWKAEDEYKRKKIACRLRSQQNVMVSG